MQQKIKEMLIKIKDVLVSVWHSYKRMRQENNIYFNILVGLVFFAIVGTGVCMVANAREAAALRQVEIQKEKEAQEKKKAEEEAKKAEEAAKVERDKSMSLQPGVAVGTMDPQDDEKVVYLTFDDGPSANTQRVLDILDQYDAKATFFITAQQPDYFPMIKKVYDEGHTIGLHSYTHEYDQVYASVDAYFDDLEKIGEVAKEQLGFVPCFIRFPGGCIVEGISLENRYQWKQTVGELKDRKYMPNLWAFDDDRSKTDMDVMRPTSAHYGQSYGLGFYEYFVLCELLGAKPLPVVGIGAACQFRSTEMFDIDSEEFKQCIQDALDLIEFANGPVDSRWGSLRAKMGHPQPFNLEMIGVGNEQWETQCVDFYERHCCFEKAIHAVAPDMKLIGSAGPIIDLPVFNEAWNFYRQGENEKKGFCYAVDEHYYVPHKWMYENIDFYDNYPRNVAVFAGEYAAHTEKKENNMESALAEAAFLTGVEKNADVVKLASYAPLFNRIGHSQWQPDMIWFDDVNVYLTPNYYVQKMYANHLGDHTLQMDEAVAKLRKQNIYISVSETAPADEKESEIIIKAVNAQDADFELPLTDEAGHAIESTGRSWILEANGENTENMPQPSHICETEINIKGSLALKAKTFTVVRF